MFRDNRQQRKIAQENFPTKFQSYSLCLTLHPSIIPHSCLSFWKSSDSQSIPTFTHDEHCLSQLLKHETQMVCKCRLWFCLMYPGYKVQRIKESSIKHYDTSLQDSRPPAGRIIGRNCFAMRWSDKGKSMIFQRLCHSSSTPSTRSFSGAWQRNCWALIEWQLIVEVCIFDVFFFLLHM